MLRVLINPIKLCHINLIFPDQLKYPKNILIFKNNYLKSNKINYFIYFFFQDFLDIQIENQESHLIITAKSKRKRDTIDIQAKNYKFS